jgi:hypothetical protein
MGSLLPLTALRHSGHYGIGCTVVNGPNRTFMRGAANGGKEPILLKNSDFGQNSKLFARTTPI